MMVAAMVAFFPAEGRHFTGSGAAIRMPERRRGANGGRANGGGEDMADSRIRIAVVGLGKIARDQHLHALAANGRFELVAVASPGARLDGTPCYDDMGAMLEAEPSIGAVALCTPPAVRGRLARLALQRGLHVLLEKPPGVTSSEVLALVDLAREKGVTLMAAWHSRHAPAVGPACRWLASREIRRVTVRWQEDVRVWHPGQGWIWRAGGLGVFDPGINALSLVTQIIPGALVLTEAELEFPGNCETPIAARLALVSRNGAPVSVQLDFRQTGRQTWDIEVDTEAGRLCLSMGGHSIALDGGTQAAGGMIQAGIDAEVGAADEYAGVYARFESLVRERRIDVDIAPLQLVADAFLCGRRIQVGDFVE